MNRMTFGAPQSAQLREWAAVNDVGAAADLLLDVTGLVARPDTLGNLLEILSSVFVQRLYEGWARTSSYAVPLDAISQAIVRSPEVLDHFPSLKAYQSANRRFPKQLDAFYLAALLLAQRPPPSAFATEEVRQSFDFLRAWILFRAVRTYLEFGYRLEIHLQQICHRLRIAADEAEPHQLSAIGSLYVGTGRDKRPDQMEHFLVQRAREALSGVTDSRAKDLLKLIIAICEDPPKEASQAVARLPGLLHTTTQRSVIPSEFGHYLEELSTFADDEDLDGDHSIPGESIGTSAFVAPASKPSIEFSHLNNRARLLLSAEAAHFLPGSWTALNSEELASILQLSRDYISSPEDHKRLLGINLEIALRCGRSLRLTLEIGFIPTESGEWHIDLNRGTLCRQSPRRRTHWKPDIECLPWVVPAQPIQELLLSTASTTALRKFTQRLEDADCLGALWVATTEQSPERALGEALSCTCPRVTPGMLATSLGTAIHRNGRDATLARLAITHPRSELPGACAYATFSKSQFDEAFNTAIPGFSSETTSEPNADSAAGSLLTVVEHMLPNLFRTAAARLESLLHQAKGTSVPMDALIAAHNAYVAYTVTLLLAATGARPVNDPFESPLDFDWDAGRVYIDDKAQGEEPFGRLVPVPAHLMDHLRDAYGAHLCALAQSLDTHTPMLAHEISALGQLGDSKHLPFFFGLSIKRQELTWTSVNESFILDCNLFDCPLPLNFLRHRLANRLRTSRVDPEIIDGILGHAEFGAESYGDQSFRTWRRDMKLAQPALDFHFGLLQAPMPGGLTVTGSLASQGPIEAPLGMPSFGREGRRLRRQAWRIRMKRLARDRVRRAVGGRDLTKLSGDALTEIGDQLLFGRYPPATTMALNDPATAGADTLQLRQTPTASGWICYRHFLSVLDRLGCLKNTSLSPKRYYTQKRVATLFTDLAPRAPAALEIIRTRLDAVIRTRTPNSHGGAALRGTLLMMVESRLADPAVLLDVLHAINHRLSRIGKLAYFEHAPGLRTHDPDAAVKRLCISIRVANLLHHSLQRKKKTPASPMPLPAEFTPVADIVAALTGQTIETAEALVRSACLIVDQVNAIDRPGIVAGLLAGRVSSWAPSQRVHAHLALGAPRSFPLPTDQEKIEPDTQLLRIPVHAAATAPTLIADRALIRDVRKLLREYGDRYPPSMTAEASISSEESTQRINRRTLASYLSQAIARRGSAVSPAIGLLTGWIASQVTRSTGKRYVAISTLLRYLGALSRGFAEIATGIDLRALDPEELTELYDYVLQVRSHTRPEYRYERLRSFHRWAEKHYEVATPDWSALPFESSSHPATFTLIREPDYLQALGRLVALGHGRDLTGLAPAMLLMLCYRFGLRPLEAVGLRRDEVIGLGAKHLIVIQTNAYRRTKTPSGSKRVVPLLFDLTDAERTLWTRWDMHLKSSTLAADAPYFCDANGRLLDRAHLYPVANQILKAVTCNAESSLYHARHTAATAALVALADLELPVSMGIPGAHEPAHRRSIQEALLGFPGISRRSSWALARYLGHNNVERSQVSYLHLMWDWAASEHHDGSPTGHIQTSIPDLCALPLAIPTFDNITSAQTQPLGVLIALQYLKLRAAGVDAQAAARGLQLAPSLETSWRELLHGVDSRLHLQGLPRDPADMESSRVLRLLRPAAWKRLHAHALAETDMRHLLNNLRHIPSIGTCLLEMTGASRQLLGWRAEHFQLMQIVRDFWLIDANCIRVVPTRVAFEDGVFDEIAARFGFATTSPGKARGKRTQIDYTRSSRVTLDGRAPHEYRAAFLLGEALDGVIRSATEMLIGTLTLVLATQSVGAQDSLDKTSPDAVTLRALEERVAALERRSS